MLSQDRFATSWLGAVSPVLFDRLLLDVFHHVGDPLTDLLRLEVSPEGDLSRPWRSLG
jgi:hypothetical protein